MDRRPRSRTTVCCRRAVLCAGLIIALGTPALRGSGGYGEPVELFQFLDSAIAESSGLAASSRDDRILFTHNDSGDAPRFFAVGPKGQTLAVCALTGARAVDWEDMAPGPGPGDRPALYFGDIGDNEGRRDSIAVYRVPEPEISLDSPSARLTLAAETITLKYPDGAHNAEALMVNPRTGLLYIATKGLLRTSVYVTRGRPRPGQTEVLTRVADLDFSAFPQTPAGRRDLIGRRLVTGGAISPDGRRLVLRTYAEAWEWPVTGDDVAGALARAPRPIVLPPIRMGEAITYRRDGKGLLVSAEGVRAPVHLLSGP